MHKFSNNFKIFIFCRGEKIEENPDKKIFVIEFFSATRKSFASRNPIKSQSNNQSRSDPEFNPWELKLRSDPEFKNWDPEFHPWEFKPWDPEFNP